jgi:hypothetical protein
LYQDNFTINIDVMVEETNGSGNYTDAGSIALPADSDNNAVFFIDSILKAFLTSKIPTYAQTTISKCTTLYKKWKFRYAEAYGAIAIFQEVIESSVYWMMRAGLSFIDYVANAYFGTWLPANKKFMTWCPNNKTISLTQHEYLNYLVFGASVTSLVLKGKCYYSDGTTQTATLLTQTGVVQKEIYLFPAGYTQLDIPGKFTIPGGKIVQKYDLWLIDQATNVISEVRTYIIEEFSFIEERGFIFENSFSAMDSLLCRGFSEDNFETEGIEAEKILADYWSLSSFDNQGNFYNTETSGSGTSKVRTGNQLTISEVRWLKELLLSNLVLELRGGKYIPVKVKRGSFKLFEPEQDIYYLEFEVMDGFKERNYSVL